MAIENTTDITWWAIASAFGGTVIGSVLGGLISFWLQRKSLAATKALHDADRREIRKTLGYSLLFKMIRLSSDLTQLGKPVLEATEKAKNEGRVEELWTTVLPLAPLPDPIKFSPEEMALVLSLDNKLFDDMAALDDLHKSTVSLFALYADKRDALTSSLRPVAMTSHGCFAVSAAEIFGQNHANPLVESRALKRRTVVSASRSASQAHCILWTAWTRSC
jgi:hypothetical protein